MASNKFKIPSAEQVQQTDTYKVKTLFDRHKANKQTESTVMSQEDKSNKIVSPEPSSSKSKETADKAESSSASKQASPVKKFQFVKKPEPIAKSSKPVSSNQKPGGSSSVSGPSLLKGAGLTTMRAQKTVSLLVNNRQKGNPLLKHIRSVVWEFSDIVADYEMSPVRCALFLSVRYHNLNPNYIHERLKLLGRNYDLRVLLVQIDVKDPHHVLKELSKICILADCTLMCSWSPEESARYLETYKAFEMKPPDLIMEKQETNFVGRVQDVLTSARKVNRTDALTLLKTYGSVEKIVDVTEEELSFIPGLGPQKAKRFHSLINEPFLKKKAKMDK